MNGLQLDTCTKDILCVDCKDTTCLHAGKNHVGLSKI